MSDGPKCYTETFPKARKEHRCCECGGRIVIGEIYHLFKGIWDEPGTYKTCIDCKELRDEIPIDEGWNFEELGDNWGNDDAFDEKFKAIMAKRGVVLVGNRAVWPTLNKEEYDNPRAGNGAVAGRLHAVYSQPRPSVR